MFKLGILDVEGTKYTLKFGQEYLLGRKSSEFAHDIEIDDHSVDIKHSIIDLTQHSSPQLFDISSKHGTFIEDIKIERFKSIPLAKTSKIRFGNVDTCLQLLFEVDSGFVDERFNSPNEDTSEIICSSPERSVSSGSRLKHSLKNSITSTPNQILNSSLPTAVKSSHNFLIPSSLPRTSINSNNSARSIDSFFIPETQHFPEGDSRGLSNSINKSFLSNISKKNNTIGDGIHVDEVDDDFFIPETQEVKQHGDVNETISQNDKIPSSQFRISTQDFNGSEENLSNQSDDVLANVPMSLVIPPIKYDTIKIHDFVNSDEDDIVNEMPALQWSKKSLESHADGSVTPDLLFDVVGSVTSDLVRESVEKVASNRSTPDVFATPPEDDDINKNHEKLAEQDVLQQNKNFENAASFRNENTNKLNEVTNDAYNENPDDDSEIEYAPTQTFIKPIPVSNSFIRSTPTLAQAPVQAPVVALASFPTPVENDCDSLPETQVFEPPVIPSIPIVHQSQTKSAIASNIDVSKESIENRSLNSGNNMFAIPLPSPKSRIPLKSQLPKLKPSPKLKSSSKPQPSPKSQTTQISVPALPDDEDDLPPTQVFHKDDHVPLPVSKTVFSSTLLDGEKQLSENSFKAKFNKLLDSDDDEMDELLAPNLVKKSLSSQPKPQHLDPVLESPITPTTPRNKTITPTNLKQSSGKVQTQQNSLSTPTNNFKYPGKAAKANNFKAPAVCIEDFKLTPDFIGKELSKNTQLQKEAEVNWRNIMLKKRNKELFGNENNQTDSDDSEDSFANLLPKSRETRSKSVNKAPSDKPKEDKKVDKVIYVRVTRRKSTSTKLESNKNIPKRKGRPKKDTKTENNESEEQEEFKKDEQISGPEKNRKKEKEPKIDKSNKIGKGSKTDKNSDPNIETNKLLGLVEKSSPSMVSSRSKDSPSRTEDKHPKKSISARESSKTKDPSAIKETHSSRPSSSVNSTKDSIEAKEQIEATEEATIGNNLRLRKRRKPTEPENKIEEKPTRSRATKRSAEVTKTSNKASKINKLDSVEVPSSSKQNDCLPSPRVTRLKSITDSKADNKNETPKNEEKSKEETKKLESKKKRKTTPQNDLMIGEPIDLTESDIEGTVEASKSKKRKSQDEYSFTSKSQVSASQSSTASTDSNRSLRKKKKLKIAMTSGTAATREILERFSGKFWVYTDDPKECDVLLLEAGNRTYKLLVAIARGIPVVTVGWLKEVIVMRSTDVSLDRYIFEDSNFEKRHKFSMRKSLQLSRASPLFDGLHFMMTPNITPKPDEMRDIIVSAGGNVLVNIPLAQDDVEFFLVSENIDNQLWYQYRRAGKEVKVVAAISLMASVMQQSLEPLMKRLR